jgi:hypothetical protein
MGQLNMSGFFEVTLGGLVGSSVSTAILGALLLRRNKLIEAEIGARFDEAIKIFQSKRLWKEQVLFELLGPIVMQFDRTKRAFARWNKRDLYLEAKIVREGNLVIRDLLLAKGHLIPSSLMEDASRLIEHYDAWLEEFESLRSDPARHNSKDYVFVGPKGYGFPTNAEAHFKEEFRRLQNELYGV